MRIRHIDLKRCKPVQAGYALVTTLIFLVVIMLLGLSVIGVTSTEEKMARNARDFDIAFSAAEAALRDAELHVTGSWRWPYVPVDLSAFDTSCSGGLCDSTVVIPSTPIERNDFYGGTTPGSNSVVLGAITGSPQFKNIATADQPRYLIEMSCSILGSMTGSTCNKIFRITAQARGRLPNTYVVLQEVYLPADFVN